MARITIATGGSRGDVQPFVAPGQGLADKGHDVRLATQNF
ncbi:MAG: glycosyltransferase [Chloroflexota bacterium]